MTTMQSLARQQEIRRASSFVADGELLLIHGPWPTEASAVALEALANLDGVVARVAVAGCGDDAELARAFVSAAAGALVGEPRLLWLPIDQLRPDQTRVALSLRRALGDSASGVSTDNWDADRPLDLVAAASAVVPFLGAAGAVLLVEGADELLTARRFSEGGSLLWAIRSIAQHDSELKIVLTGGPAAGVLTEGEDQAFLGWGRSLYLDRVPSGRLAEALVNTVGSRLSSSALIEIIELAEGAPWVAEAVTERLRSSEAMRDRSEGDAVERPVGPRDAWHSLVDSSAVSLEATMRLAGELHRSAHAVCFALAHARPPYSVGRPSDVNRALHALHRQALVERAAARSWRLCNPLLAQWLRQSSTSLR